MAHGPRLSAESSAESDDDRSSSLSDLDEGLEPDPMPGTAKKKMVVADGDSEAETERLEISPNKAAKEEQVSVDFAPLDQSLPESSAVISAIHQLETERFSDSAISSPGSSEGELLSDGASDHVAGVRSRAFDGSGASQMSAGRKRKRASQENGSDIGEEEGEEEEEEDEDRSRRKRIGSIRSEADRGPSMSDDDGSSSSDLSRAGSQDPMDVNEDPDDDAMVDANDDDILPRTDQTGDVLAESKIAKITISKARQSIHENPDEGIIGQEEEDQIEGPEESDEEDLVEADEAEDAEAIARSEEERKEVCLHFRAQQLTCGQMQRGQQRWRPCWILKDDLRLCATGKQIRERSSMLADLFRLYDERIAALNSELAQLSGPNPTHTELLRQVQCVQQYRDEKFDIEQKLLVFKIGALKRKSIAERSQIHSAYLQTIREVRERHLEKASEHFYRIQRDRFKTDESIPNYSVPFPSRRSVQITQQTAYNKEVSVLSGAAKHVGFPAAPDIASARTAELNEDMEKMGVSANSNARSESST